MHRFSCVVVDHCAGRLLSQAVALLRERVDIDCEVTSAQAARRARADLLIVCSGPEGRATLLPFIAECRGRDGSRALLVVGELDSEKDLRALNALGVSDFMRLPLSGAEFNARIERVLGLHGRVDVDPVADWLGAGEPMLASVNARFNAQLARLPRLAGAGVDVIICGAPGSGRRAFARTLARMAGDPAPRAVDAASIDAWLAEREMPGGGEGESRCLLVYDLEHLPPGAQHALHQRLQARGTAGRAWRLVATASADATTLQGRGELIAPLAEQLRVHRVRVLSLRERPEDVVPLARALIGAACAREQRPLPGLTPSAAARLMSHAWPDNVYGLRRALERSLRAAGPMIAAQDLLLEGADEHDAREQSLQEVKAHLVVSFERSFLEQLLEVCRGNINMAARLSKKNRRSLFELIRKHDIDVDRYRRMDDAVALPAKEPLPRYQAGLA